MTTKNETVIETEGSEEGTVEVENQEWDEFMSSDQDKDGDGAEGADAPQQESPEVKAAREAAEAAQKAFEEARAREELEARVKTYRELPEAQRDTYLLTAYLGEKAREDFVEHVESIERQELIDRLLDGDDEALLAGYREADDILRAELEDAVSDDQDRLRMLISRSQENVVSLPVVEAEEVQEPEAIDWIARWTDSALAEVTDAGQYAQQFLADVRKGVVKVDKEIKAQLEELEARANALPDGHSHRERALTEIAGVGEWARAEYEKARPFGLGGIKQTTRYFGADGQWHQIEVDGFGSKRESVLENAAAPSELGILKDEPATPEQIDFENITPEQARRLTPPQWLEINEKNPSLAEKLRRSSQAKQKEERSLEMRTGQL
jgi:hypothetical protein